MVWEDLILKGYYNDKQVIEKKFSKEPVPSELYVSADDYVLDSSQKDATRIVVKILDQCGNLLPFIDEIIKVEVKGPAKIQGPNELVVKGGAIAFWIETINESGEVDIKIKSQSLGQKDVRIIVE
jgi:beta-galactosidase